jgi:hypothetical protein
MKCVIDNPGGGDCGFYAFSIALIEIIQQEVRSKKISPTFQKWQELGLVSVELGDLLKVNLSILASHPRTHSGHLFNTLQMSLRDIVAESRKEEFKLKMIPEKHSESNLSQVHDSAIYREFTELFQAFSEGKKSGKVRRQLSDYNDLALSSDVRDLAKRAADEWAIYSQGIVGFKERNVAEMAFLSKILTEDAQSDSPVILKGTDAIKKKGRWATHTHLKELAVQFKVNLCLSNEYGTVDDQLPTVTLNNQRGAHWTTTVNLPEKKSSLYREHVREIIWMASKGEFANVSNPIDVRHIDKAEANAGESDEDFARRLQDAEYRASRPK